MAGPERILDVIAQGLKDEAKAQLELNTAVLKAQTNRQLSAQLSELGVKRAMGEAEAEAAANAPAQDQQQPFRLSDLTAIKEQRVSARQPLQQVNPGQFTKTVGQMGQGGQALPQAAQGLPVAGEEIVTRTQTANVSPERVGQQGFVMVPSAQEQVSRTPNALSAQDVARLRQREQEFAATSQAEEARFQQTEKRLRAGQFAAAFQDLTGEGVRPQQASALAQAVASGDSARVAELAKGLPKALSARVRESAIRSNEANARLAQARMAAELSKQGQARSRLDFLAGFANFHGEEPPSMEQLRISLTQGLEQENKVLLRDAQIGYLARGQAVFLEPSGLSRLWGSQDARGLDAYEVVGRIAQYQSGSAQEAQAAQEALEELGFSVRATRMPDGSAVAELQPPEGLDEDLGRGLLRIARGRQVALSGGQTLEAVAPAPSDPGGTRPPEEEPFAGMGRKGGVNYARDLEKLRQTLSSIGGAIGNPFKSDFARAVERGEDPFAEQ